MAKFTKKLRIELTQQLIDRHKIGQYFDDDAIEELSRLLCCCVEGAYRKVNPQFPSDPRHLVTKIDGLWDARSWRKMIQQTATPESEAKRVMRFLVRDDMQEFKDSVEPACAQCGAESDLTVDHVDPSFIDLADAFFITYGVPDIIDNPDTNMVTKCFKDFDLESKWVHFHSESAIYQILCRSCNAKKGG